MWQVIIDIEPLRPVHHRLWKIGIHHRNIGRGSLAYRRERNGDIVGVLTDFDWAWDASKNRSNKTGTLPFLSLTILGDMIETQDGRTSVPHLYRFDLEAFLYVLIHEAIRWTGGLGLCTSVQVYLRMHSHPQVRMPEKPASAGVTPADV